MQIRLLAFGPARDAVGSDAVMVSLPEGCTIEALVTEAVRRFPALNSLSGRMAFACNAAWAGATTVLCEGDEVALIPPVSGG